MKRRRFLVSAGGLMVGLPLLRKFVDSSDVRAAGLAGEPTRIIVIGVPMGTHLPAWTPSATGSNFTLPQITAPLQPFVDRCAFISNTPNAVLELGGNTYVYGHPAKRESAFTGTLLVGAFGGDGSNHVDNTLDATQPLEFSRDPNGMSVETFIGERLMQPTHLRPSVDLGVWGNGGSNLPASDPATFFYEGPANPVTMIPNPALAFASVFNGVMPDTGEVDPEFLALQRRRKSVLDSVRDSFVDLRQGLDAKDRAVLDDHADKIRQIELDMPPLASCTLPENIPADGAGEYAAMTMMELADLQNRIMAHAMGCGIAPVGRIEYLEQQRPFFGIPMVDDAVATVQDWHHPIVHAADGWTKDDPVRVTGFTFFTEKVAELMAQLDAIVEGADGETALDNSLIVMGSDLGEGDGHNAYDTCWLIAGGSGPGRRNYHLEGSGHSVNDILNTVIAMACITQPDGSPVPEFGLPGFGAGPIAELLV